MQKVIVKEELENFFKPVPEKDGIFLEMSLRKYGQDAPILLGCIDGEEEDVFIIDGHRRYRKMLSLNREPIFSTKVKTFGDMDEVFEWMIGIEGLVRREHGDEGARDESSY